MQKINRTSGEIRKNGKSAQIFAKKFGSTRFEVIRKEKISERKRKIDAGETKKQTKTKRTGNDHIFFDIAPIPDRYYPLYEKCVNMEPEIEIRQRAEWGLLRRSKRRFLV